MPCKKLHTTCHRYSMPTATTAVRATSAQPTFRTAPPLPWFRCSCNKRMACDPSCLQYRCTTLAVPSLLPSSTTIISHVNVLAREHHREHSPEPRRATRAGRHAHLVCLSLLQVAQHVIQHRRETLLLVVCRHDERHVQRRLVMQPRERHTPARSHGLREQRRGHSVRRMHGLRLCSCARHAATGKRLLRRWRTFEKGSQ